ncbi:restriction endonuclease subunit S [Clostridium botulinum]|uniref:restriction endonuclease subunit S n=1 Tax=Clostridium botulinum TaxID=1491 RepID=UPI00096DB788|nr:restriction endonuclease subunit S [Clostridium botulinum]MBE1302742.1 restriction endonuclease subunit S [Clostridium botulinum]
MADKEPKIRFDGFNEDWKGYKLSEISDRYKELIPTPTDGYWRLGVRSHAKGTFLRYVPPGKQLGEAELSKVLPNNIMFNIVFAWEHAVAITKDGDEKALVSHRFPQFTFHEDMSPDFFRYAILDERFRHHLWLASPSGAGRNKTLILDEAIDYKFTIPKQKEQEKVAAFLTHLDKLIEEQQNKFQKYVIIKKNLLNKLFPQKGSKIPEMRIADFNEEWSERKLWSITIWDKKFNEVDSEKQPKIIKYPYVLADVFNQIEDNSGTVRLLSTGNYQGYTTEEKAGENLCEGEVVAIPWGGVPNVKYYNGKFVTADNRIATSSDIKVLNNKFLSLWMQSHLDEIGSMYRGASIKHPSMREILEMDIQLPSLKEQEKITSLVFGIEELIDFEQSKIDKLQNIRKSCLENMLI